MRALTEASDPTREDWAFKVSLDTCQAHFMRALTEASDPTREDWASLRLQGKLRYMSGTLYESPDLTEASDPTHFMRALTEASGPTREDWAFKVSLDTCQALTEALILLERTGLSR